MKKWIQLPILFLLSITLMSCDNSENDLPLEMIAFGQLTKGEQDLIPVSPKDARIEEVTVTSDIQALLDPDFNNEKVYAVTFNHTDTPSGKLTVFIDMENKTVVGKGFLLQ